VLMGLLAGDLSWQVALAADGNTLYLGSWDYNLYALDVATG
jgi:hypothetical protein